MKLPLWVEIDPDYEPSINDANDNLIAYFVDPNNDEEHATAVARMVNSHAALLAALKHAKMFIENGVKFGFIQMPDKGDPALDTLLMIRAAIAAATQEEPTND